MFFKALVLTAFALLGPASAASFQKRDTVDVHLLSLSFLLSPVY
jgi:hypothetical protein